jgi:3-hydroxybutyryl-CoA dehydrogenase
MRACVVGAGTMGHGIAFILAQADIDTCLIDESSQALKKSLSDIDRLIEDGLQKEKFSLSKADKISERISSSVDLDILASADLMIETVNEDLSVKRHIFSIADALVEDHGILASNTSGLSITAIADAVVQKERVLGLHFFNPPHIMKLLEIIVHDEVSLETVNFAKELALKLRKESIVVNDSPGFATSRLGITLALEAIRMLETGVSGVIELDTAMRLGFGHPMGPLMLSDWVGLDVRLAISENLYRSLDSVIFKPPELLRSMVRAGFLGKKSGTGFYEWDNQRHLGVSQACMELLNL